MRLWYFKDPVHVYIMLPEPLVKCVIDTPLFQRLRGIKQNQLGHYVYPHLEHTRFSHSLGVAYLVLKALESICSNIESITIPTLCSGSTDNYICKSLKILLKILSSKKLVQHIAAVGLIHDIAHGPYSHLYENAVKELREIFGDVVQRAKGYEYVNEKLKYQHDDSNLLNSILGYLQEWAKKVNGCNDEELDFGLIMALIMVIYGDSLDISSAEDLCRILIGKRLIEQNINCRETATKHAFLILLRLAKDLYDSNIDMDKVDYVIRDSIAAGVKYGIFDYERLLSVLTITPFPLTKFASEPALGIIDKGVSIVENLLLSRAYMYSELYLHRIKAVYDLMLARFITLMLLAAAILEDSVQRCESEEHDLLTLLPYKALQNTAAFLRFNDRLVDRLVEKMALAIVSKISSLETRDAKLVELIVKAFNRLDEITQNTPIQLSKLYCVSAHVLAYAVYTRSVLPLYIVPDPDYERQVIDRYQTKKSIINETIKRCPLIMVYHGSGSVYTAGDNHIERDIRVLPRISINAEDYVRKPPQLGKYERILAQELINRRFNRFVLVLPITLRNLKNVRVKPIRQWMKLDLLEGIGEEVLASACDICGVESDEIVRLKTYIDGVSREFASELFGT